MKAPTTEARFPSRCGVCDGEINEGDRVCLIAEDDEWVHEECCPEEDE